MAKFAQRLRELREAEKLSQQKFADRIGITKSSINMYERGEREPGLETIELIADFFEVDLDYLLGKSDIPNKNLRSLPENIYDIPGIFPITTQRIPFLGDIACGEPIYASEDRESYISAGTDIGADFCLKAKGDSMINARIFDGDVVFIREQPMVENGEIAAVIIDDEATLKRVYYNQAEGQIILSPENPAYSPLVYSGEKLNEIKILGKAIAFQSDVK
ncbi:MAG: helix-turn-helix domain-containing protein [Oscillospiraceae bacterium]|nr:helix-turn-helix domain-containing protein [Oscillospiraceae bacterium]